jgi:cyclin-dependent kinase regulatory subunit CKS1
MPREIIHSDKYQDKTYEYKHVILPRHWATELPNRLLTEEEWRAIGVQQSKGWEHYFIYRPEPHVLLFRRQLQVKRK